VAERTAAAHLADSGYTILDRNWSDRRGELDIVARRGDVVAVVEVRGLRSESVVRPVETVDYAKRKQVCETAVRWLALHPGLRDQCFVRFDVIGVRVDGVQGRCVEHVEGAFVVDDVVPLLR
jgi:putative endonuclease